jgi:simple sugar transport system permease protein
MIVSGGLAGLAGGLIITGESFRLMVGISRDYGYVGIGVAMLASLSSLPTIPSAIFFSTLVTGA